MSSINFMSMDGDPTAKNSRLRCCTMWFVVSIIIIVGLVIGLIVLGTKQTASNDTISTTPLITWCTVSTDEQAKCLEMNRNIPIKCHQEKDVDSCVTALGLGKADAVTLDGGHIFSNEDNIKPVMGEDYGEGDATYWAVAVVKKADTTTYFTKAGLQGKVSCHTGYGKTAGWVMPLGAMKTKNIISGCNMTAAITGLFSKSCAPNEICTACKGTCNRNCDGEDYCGYTGSFRCLAEGSGNVAFVKHSTVGQNTDGQNNDSWAKNLSSTDFELLCSDGSRAPVSAFSTCNLGRVPSHAVVVKKSASSELVQKVVEFLTVAQLRYGPHTSSDFKLFGGPIDDLMFKSSTQQLLQLTETCTAESFLGNGYLAAQNNLICQTYTPTALESCLLPQNQQNSDSTVRWCVTKEDEFKKCQEIAAAVVSLPASDMKVTCVSGGSVQNCATLLSLNSADVVTMDGGEISTASREYNLQPIASEDYGGDEGTSYYAVAAIKASDVTTFFNHSGLQGKKTCHTGYGKTSGWNVPVGLMYEKDILVGDSKCDNAAAVSNFFGGSCVPGIRKENKGASVENKLCQLCNDSCAKSDKYAGYTGSLNCLKEGLGEIAFIKHTTISDAERSGFKLLCPNGTIDDVANYLQCNLAKVPAHALMTTNFHSFNFREKVWTMLEQVQDANPNLLFTSPDGSSNVIFKDSTVCLRKVFETCRWPNFLGKAYLDAIEGLQCTTAETPYETEPPCQYVASAQCPSSK